MLCGSLLDDHRNTVGFLPSRSVSESFSSAGAGLTFAERVAYQRAIEDVYWRHRIWPRERPDPKPSLDAVMSQAQLEKKVDRLSAQIAALEDYWQRPVTAEQLQAEMDRMAQNTKQPEVLRELFEALGNDPFVIAECLARPVLAERLLTNSGRADQEPVGRAQAESGKHGRAWCGSYTLPIISDRSNGDARASIHGRPRAPPTRPAARTITPQCGPAAK